MVIFDRFLEYFKQRQKEQKEQEEQEKLDKSKKIYNVWIVKPGENTNRGQGIEIYDNLNDINASISK